LLQDTDVRPAWHVNRVIEHRRRRCEGLAGLLGGSIQCVHGPSLHDTTARPYNAQSNL